MAAVSGSRNARTRITAVALSTRAAGIFATCFGCGAAPPPGFVDMADGGLGGWWVVGMNRCVVYGLPVNREIVGVVKGVVKAMENSSKEENRGV